MSLGPHPNFYVWRAFEQHLVGALIIGHIVKCKNLLNLISSYCFDHPTNKLILEYDKERTSTHDYWV